MQYIHMYIHTCNQRLEAVWFNDTTWLYLLGYTQMDRIWTKKLQEFLKNVHCFNWWRFYTTNQDHQGSMLWFLSIFGEKNCVFLKKQINNQIFAKTSSSLSKKRHFFVEKFFGENILKIITSVPVYRYVHCRLVLPTKLWDRKHWSHCLETFPEYKHLQPLEFLMIVTKGILAH
jgi:hypothetical protein